MAAPALADAPTELSVSPADARRLRALDQAVRRAMSAAEIAAARAKVEIGDATAAGRSALEEIVLKHGGDPTLDWTLDGTTLRVRAS